MKLDEGVFRLDPWKPFNLYPLQEFFLFSLAILGKNEDLMTSSLQSYDELNKERGLNNVIRAGWKRRSNNANIHYFVLVMVNSGGKFG
jgi:hypothetical protein